MLTNKLGTSYVEYKYAGYSSSSVAQGVTAQVLDCQSDAGASAYAGYSQKAEDYLSDVQAYVKTVASATSDVPTIPTVTVPTIVSVADPAPVTTTSGTRPVLPVTVGLPSRTAPRARSLSSGILYPTVRIPRSRRVRSR